MTREEAITIIRTVEYMACEEDDFPDGADEAIDMAIEALKREDAMLKEIERTLLYGERSE